MHMFFRVSLSSLSVLCSAAEGDPRGQNHPKLADVRSAACFLTDSDFSKFSCFFEVIVVQVISSLPFTRHPKGRMQ